MNKLSGKGYVAAILIFSFVQVIITEAIFRGSFISFFIWMYENKSEFIVNYLTAVCLITLLVTVCKKVNWSFFVVLSMSFLISLVSKMKMAYLGEPLMPWDFVLANETRNIITNFPNIANFKLVLIILLYLLVMFTVVVKLPEKRCYRFREKAIPRIIIAMLCISFIFSVSLDRFYSIRNKLGIEMISWDQGDNYEKNGVAAAFLMNIRWLSVEKPSEYSRDSVQSVIGNIDYCNGDEKTASPNIIVIMSEAFWDPCVMKNVSFSEDPIPFFRSMQKEHTSGWLLSPVFGGGTVNTEFEVLTGNSMRFLPEGSISYAQYVRRPLDSLAGILARQGYASTAVHSYHSWFYRRNEVYKNLGFQKFISGEFFIDPKYKGDYIADSEISQIIINETQKTVGPDFIFAVTMQSHGPYAPDAVSSYNITVDGPLSHESKGILQSYIRQINDADKALQSLVEYYKKCGEETMIVFFGDHLPLLGEKYQVYKEAGFYNNEGNAEEYKCMHSVPVLVWSNYLPEQNKININASFLGSYILKITQKDNGSAYMNYLYSKSKQMPLVLKEDLLNTENTWLQDYRLLQYDMLFGNEYLLTDEKPQIIAEDYFLGRERMSVEKIIYNKGDKLFLELDGKNFVPGTQLYVNGKSQPVEFKNENCVTVDLDGKYFKKQEELKISLKLLDSMKNVIAESNETKVTLSEEPTGTVLAGDIK